MTGPKVSQLSFDLSSSLFASPDRNRERNHCSCVKYIDQLSYLSVFNKGSKSVIFLAFCDPPQHTHTHGTLDLIQRLCVSKGCMC